MAGISSKAAGKLENRLKYNEGSEFENKEFSDGYGLEMYDTKFRKMDPQIGRFLQIDPLSIISNNSSPYAYVMNNPILFNDPLGLDTVRVTGSMPKNMQKGTVVSLSQSNGGTSYYTYDPDNADADENGLVGSGMADDNDEIVVTAKKGGNSSNSNVSINIVQASFVNGDFSGSDAINIALGLGGQLINQLQANLTYYRKNTVLPKAVMNGFNSHYRRQLCNINLGIKKLDRYGKRLGAAGLVLQGGNLTYNYLWGDGITNKQVFDASVSIILSAVTISNPAFLIGVGIYGLLDSFGTFDGLKESIGANDDIMLKRE
jgi:RHS repeat-associated protein